MPSQEELAVETRRLTAPEIFSAAVENAREELRRPARSLAFSGLAGGLTMGLTGLSVAAVRAILGSGTWEELVSFVVYPVGFIAVIIGRAQLFTENTLYPVVLVLDERHRRMQNLAKTLQLWAVVSGSVTLASYFHWLLLATLGNIVGGVVIVSLLNYGQVRGQ